MLTVGCMLARTLLGGIPPLRFFLPDSEKTAARSAAGFSPTFPGNNCAYFILKEENFTISKGQVTRSGQVIQPPNRFVIVPWPELSTDEHEAFRIT